MRWQVRRIGLYSHHDAVREIAFKLNAVNVITGTSGTGKSAVLSTINYCLGSSTCELPDFVRQRVVGVAVEWQRGSESLLIGREVESFGERGSPRFRVATGSLSVDLPRRWSMLGDPASNEDVQTFYARAFGIEHAHQLGSENQPTRITVRNVVPFLFLSKGVIDSEKTMFFGFDDKRRRESHERAMPYLLGAVEPDLVGALNRMRTIRTQIRVLSRKSEVIGAEGQFRVARAHELRREAERAGIAAVDQSEVDVFDVLEFAAKWTQGSDPAPPNSALGALEGRRLEALGQVRALEDRRSTLLAARHDSNAFAGALSLQERKLSVVEHIGREIAGTCPTCSAPTEGTSSELDALRASLSDLSARITRAARMPPVLNSAIGDLEEELRVARSKLREIEMDYRNSIQQEGAQKDRFQAIQWANRVAGRISLFLEDHGDRSSESLFDAELEALERELTILTERYGTKSVRDAGRALTYRISRSATSLFSRLPRIAPCDTASILFDVEGPRLGIVTDDGRFIPMASIGSDKNYLALHVALSLALQGVLGKDNRPVPGCLVIDQISRPFYPSIKKVISIEEDGYAQPEVRALRMHLRVLFDAVADSQEELQVILLEHADFPQDPEYTDAVQHRWGDGPDDVRFVPDKWPTVR